MSDEKSNDLDAFLDQESKDAVDDDASSLLDGVESEDNNQLISEEEDTLLADELTNEQQSSLGETDISNMVEEANESLITGNPDPFSTEDFERLNTSLVNIESKIDNDKSRLKKLDLLDDIKNDIARISQNLSNIDSSPKQGHNLPNIDQLLARIDELENKLNNQDMSGGAMPADNEMNLKLDELTKSVQKLNLSSGTMQKRFERVEETVGRFEDMEKDIQVEYVDEKESTDSSEENKKKIVLYGTLVCLILIVCGAIVLDRLNIMDFYLDELFRAFFN